MNHFEKSLACKSPLTPDEQIFTQINEIIDKKLLKAARGCPLGAKFSEFSFERKV